VRSTVTGSRRLDRQAGSAQARAATKIKTAGTPKNVTASDGLTLCSRLSSRRDADQAAPIPATTPRSTGRMPSAIACHRIVDRSAPIAIRMPNSLSRNPIA